MYVCIYMYIYIAMQYIHVKQDCPVSNRSITSHYHKQTCSYLMVYLLLLIQIGQSVCQ